MTTYSSPKSQFCSKWEESVNVDLGEGWVVIYNLNIIDPLSLPTVAKQKKLEIPFCKNPRK